MTRYDAVNFIAHGVAKDPSYGEPVPSRARMNRMNTRRPRLERPRNPPFPNTAST